MKKFKKSQRKAVLKMFSELQNQKNLVGISKYESLQKMKAENFSSYGSQDKSYTHYGAEFDDGLMKRVQTIIHATETFAKMLINSDEISPSIFSQVFSMIFNEIRKPEYQLEREIKMIMIMRNVKIYPENIIEIPKEIYDILIQIYNPGIIARLKER